MCTAALQRSSIWAAAGREGVQHADSDVKWRGGRRDLGLNLDPKTQDPLCAHSVVRL